MARQCPECGHLNDDGLGFCSECGEAVDPELILALKLKNLNSRPKEAPKQAKPVDDGDYVPSSAKKEQKSSVVPLVILGVAVIAIVVVVLFVL